MKIFFKNWILYISAFGGLIVLIELSTAYIINHHVVFQLTPKSRYIILGHSQPECAYNDSLIPEFKNLAQSGESYYYTYFKTKKILEQNKNIETVFIEFTNNQISSIMDEWTWSDKHISYRYPLYSSFMGIDDRFILIQKNPTSFLNAVSFSLKYRCKRIRNNDNNYIKDIGGYQFLVRDKTDSLLNTINLQGSDHGNFINATGTSEINLLYLDKIIELCKIHNKKIFLIRSPQHSKSGNYKNESEYRRILLNRLGDLEYLDFSKVPMENYEFGDLEHLNYRGARKYSNWFAQLIKNGLLTKENKQLYINNCIKMNLDSASSNTASLIVCPE
jgi:hypothetical protein